MTAVRFSSDARRMFTCGGDKRLALSHVAPPNDVATAAAAAATAAAGKGGTDGAGAVPVVSRYKSVPLNQGMVYDMASDVTGKYVITAYHPPGDPEPAVLKLTSY